MQNEKKKILIMATETKNIEFTSTYNGKKRVAKASKGIHNVFAVIVSNGKKIPQLKIFANRQAWRKYKRANPGTFISRIDYNGAVKETEATGKLKVIE